MNSLVVLFSMLALAAAAPSGALLAYYAPAAGYSQQSRVDIKSSPAIVANAHIEEPSLYAAPLAYTAPTAIAAPAAVSHQSRIDIKSSPVLVDTYEAAPIAYATPLGPAAIAPTLLKSYAAPAYAAALLKASPALIGTPAAIAAPVAVAAPGAIAAPTVPLDTPEVIAARAAHLEAKALAGAHLIHKRSAPLLHTPLISTYAATPLAHTYAHISPISPITYSAPIYTSAYGLRHW